MTVGATLPRRLLGRQLAELREQAGITMAAAAAAIAVGKSTLWRIETGQQVRLNPVLLERLCQLYGAAPEVTSALLGLIEETKTNGWWCAFTDTIPKDFGLFVGLEDSANRLTSYQTTFLPGLLHTPEYRRALIWLELPNAPADEVERTLAGGLQRQARLTDDRNPLDMDVLIDESVLRRVTGSTSVMAEQLRHLDAVSQRPNVSIRVVPAAIGTYKGLIVGSFVLLEFPRHPKADLSTPPVVYVQGYTGDLYLEKPSEIAQYREVRAEIGRRALDNKDSRALIREIAEEYESA
ncbi:helix-turn-helix domain-containing protein [Nocardia carnea]|uniref:helix-turn-helix domain-containing protein n=1 Tax=Nocardia carnea TaxID=37328 RepID=UPI0024548333|nr:helix-turn-helix transcriptional regulator [Nocardia carnea]